MIYFDNAATSYYKPACVKHAVKQACNFLTANPGRSGHKPSIEAGEMVFETREKLKNLMNAPNHQVVFTKNCTEALNLALFGCLSAGDGVITSCFEHNSVLRPLEFLKSVGVKVEVLDCSLAEFHTKLNDAISPSTKLVVVTGMSNVTGESPNLVKVGEVCKNHNVLLLVDGAQLTGHMDIDLEKMNIDMYSFAGHKGLCSITGIGGLFLKDNIRLKPLLYGGTGTESNNLIQPKDLPEGLEAGTLPTIPIASLNAGVDFVSKNKTHLLEKEEELSRYMFKRLVSVKNIIMYSSAASKNVFSFNILGMDSMLVADILNEKYGVCVRAGLHCAPLVHKKLGSLQIGAVRASIDFANTKQEIDYFVRALNEIAANLC